MTLGSVGRDESSWDSPRPSSSSGRDETKTRTGREGVILGHPTEA